MNANKKTIKEKDTKNLPENKQNLLAAGPSFFKKLGKKAWLLAFAVVVVIGIIISLVNNNINQQKMLASMQTSAVRRGDLVAIVGATGTVNANQSADLPWQTSGRIGQVNVKLNEQVVKDQVLAELDPTTVSQAINTARAELVAARRNLEDALQSKTAEADAYLTLVRADDKVQTTKNDRDRWNYKNSDWVNVYKARSEFLLAANELKNAQYEYDRMITDPTPDADLAAAREKLAAAQLANDKALRALNLLLGRTYDNTVAEDFARYDLAKAQADDARRAWARLVDSPTKDDIEAAQARVDAAEATVRMAKIIVPFSGTVTKADAKAGDQATTGITSFRVDDLSHLYIKVEIPEVDVNQVQAGQRVELTFDAVLGKKFTGNVTQVEPVGVDKQGVVNFTITIELNDGDGEVRPGMTAAVNIVVSEIKNVLIVPNRAITKRGGAYIVFVLRNNQTIQVPVEIGASSDIDTEIVKGDLNESDLVIVNPPTQLIDSSGSSMPGGGMPGFLR
jgi:HlyD family secretion protein